MARATDLRVRLGQRVRELRTSQGLSLEVLAERASLSHKYLQSVEAARQAATIDTIQKIADGLAVSAVDLFLPDWNADAATVRQFITKRVGTVGDLDRLREIAEVVDVLTKPRRR